MTPVGGANRHQVDANPLAQGGLGFSRELSQRRAQALEPMPVDALGWTTGPTGPTHLDLDRHQHPVRILRNEVELAVGTAPSAGEDRPAAR